MISLIAQIRQHWHVWSWTDTQYHMLNMLIQDYIRPGTVIYSDEWRAYSQLNTLGYEHRTVNHSKNFVDRLQKFFEWLTVLTGLLLHWGSHIES